MKLDKLIKIPFKNLTLDLHLALHIALHLAPPFFLIALTKKEQVKS